MRLLLLGFGTVGQGLAELILQKKALLKEKYNLDLQVVGISDTLKGSITNPKGIDLAAALEKAKNSKPLTELGGAFSGSALEMVAKVDADMMVEMTYTDIKTAEPATSHIKAALGKKMHVTTTNKGPLALHYHDLAELARANKVRFFFEGTVMSGTPLLNLVRETLAGCRVNEMKGILNGTTNYILTRMEEGMSYDAALKKAQELGFAEAVPDADVLGWDALAKITILANAVFGVHKKPADFSCKGITEITPQAITEAKARGKRFKLIGRVWRDGEQVKGSVNPEEVDLMHPLAGVMGSTNAVTISTDILGDTTIVGPGAGRAQTGYSVLVDIIAAGGAR